LNKFDKYARHAYDSKVYLTSEGQTSLCGLKLRGPHFAYNPEHVTCDDCQALLVEGELAQDQAPPLYQTAQGTQLDNLAALWELSRGPGETDNDLRDRVIAKANMK
jgi:hypothetical protein